MPGEQQGEYCQFGLKHPKMDGSHYNLSKSNRMSGVQLLKRRKELGRALRLGCEVKRKTHSTIFGAPQINEGTVKLWANFLNAQISLLQCWSRLNVLSRGCPIGEGLSLDFEVFASRRATAPWRVTGFLALFIQQGAVEQTRWERCFGGAFWWGNQRNMLEPSLA